MIEIPPYDVVTKKDLYEIRQYHKQVWAQYTYEVPLNTDFSKVIKGFQPLYKYIAGNNEQKLKIAMTAPVVMKQKIGQSSILRLIAFIMSPSKFKSIDQLPKANDLNVKLVEADNIQQLACIRFNMNMNTRNNDKKEQELRAAATKDGVELLQEKAEVQYFGYNPPWTLPWFKRNEICIPIIVQK
ncbi:unnamed protein product [Didymodactylos carnosus]|uniref:SOUL heme-binding protein n=2 Tax=Didymodactylos carnosus TaxID=1234261 RepID=A0A8S2H6G5_9BILA|nr:unnamed protein product [Didymodactylos carnosus]CAF3601105.1 unnamed protein product [Didymodactylos carnosus]CAF4026034.1 unnamed protein product [Didymodactylos carnosus]